MRSVFGMDPSHSGHPGSWPASLPSPLPYEVHVPHAEDLCSLAMKLLGNTVFEFVLLFQVQERIVCLGLKNENANKSPAVKAEGFRSTFWITWGAFFLVLLLRPHFFLRHGFSV